MLLHQRRNKTTAGGPDLRLPSVHDGLGKCDARDMLGLVEESETSSEVLKCKRAAASKTSTLI